MQRLFTTFPNSWPGAGLLWFRLILAAAILQDRTVDPAGVALWYVFQGLELSIGVLLVFGLWTPIASVVQFLLMLVILGTGNELNGARQLIGLLYLSLAVLGPGAWSADAFLFGRRRMDIDL
jgi:putative oxidoreductase